MDVQKYQAQEIWEVKFIPKKDIDDTVEILQGERPFLITNNNGRTVSGYPLTTSNKYNNLTAIVMPSGRISHLAINSPMTISIKLIDRTYYGRLNDDVYKNCIQDFVSLALNEIYFNKNLNKLCYRSLEKDKCTQSTNSLVSNKQTVKEKCNVKEACTKSSSVNKIPTNRQEEEVVKPDKPDINIDNNLTQSYLYEVIEKEIKSNNKNTKHDKSKPYTFINPECKTIRDKYYLFDTFAKDKYEHYGFTYRNNYISINEILLAKRDARVSKIRLSHIQHPTLNMMMRTILGEYDPVKKYDIDEKVLEDIKVHNKRSYILSKGFSEYESYMIKFFLSHKDLIENVKEEIYLEENKYFLISKPTTELINTYKLSQTEMNRLRK